MISAIPDNAEYTVRLYAQDVTVVDTVSDIPLQTYTYTIPIRPYLNSELSASLFPQVTTPATHNINDINWGGSQDIVWTNPAGALVDWAELNWNDPATSDNLRLGNGISGITTSTTLDLSYYTYIPTSGYIYLGAIEDLTSRKLIVHFDLQ